MCLTKVQGMRREIKQKGKKREEIWSLKYRTKESVPF